MIHSTHSRHQLRVTLLITSVIVIDALSYLVLGDARHPLVIPFLGLPANLYWVWGE